MVKKTFIAKGISYASELTLKNIIDLEKVIDWNIQHGILFYRMSSDMFPWMSEYELSDLPDILQIKIILNRIGDRVKEFNLRLTYHPGPFNVLASNNDAVIAKTIKELRQHGEIMDMLALPRSPFSKINIHIGGAYGDKSVAMKRFIKNFALLPSIASSRITIENDDKANMFSVKDLMEVYKDTGIPVVFDYHHHQFCTGGLSEQEALALAYDSWPKGVTPVVHYSSAKKQFEDSTATPPAHSNYIYESINRYGFDVDIMLEAKAKEIAMLKFIEDYTLV